MTKEEKSKWSKEWYLKNREAAIAKSKEYQRLYPEVRKRAVNKWRKLHPERSRLHSAKWKQDNPDLVKTYYINSSRELTNMYVARVLIAGDKSLRVKDIPVELVEAKREIINLKRAYNEKRLKVC